MPRIVIIVALALAILLLAVGGWAVAAFRACFRVLLAEGV
jgi:hypothetical protein